jgi:response regulator RpfG family c-di-GMP phosphodiesterase
MAEKQVNYTPEQTLQVVEAYRANPTAETVEALANELGKTVRSIVAKLSREGVYKKKEYVGKTGEKPVKKDELADRLAEVFGLTESEADSLTKANKTALNKILAKVAELS